MYIITYTNIYIMLTVLNSCVNFSNKVFLTDNAFAIHLTIKTIYSHLFYKNNI